VTTFAWRHSNTNLPVRTEISSEKAGGTIKPMFLFYRKHTQMPRGKEEEWILERTEFVAKVLKMANEQFERSAIFTS